MSWVKGISPRTLHEQFGLYKGNWMPEMDRCWEDYERGYSVCSRMIHTKQFGNVEHVTITRQHSEGSPLIPTGGEMAIGWKEKMMIKNELFGEDRFAIEVYPKQENLIEQHIQQNGFLSDEAGKELRKILMGEQGHGKD